MSGLTRNGTAEPVSRDKILRHARGQGNIKFPCTADHEQDWQPYLVDAYSAICDDHTYIQWHRMTRMTGPDCVVMCNLINTYIHTYCLSLRLHYTRLFPDPRFLLFVLQNISGYKNAVECLLQ